MIKQMVAGFCWNLRLLWTLDVYLRELALFKRNKESPGLFQDLTLRFYS